MESNLKVDWIKTSSADGHGDPFPTNQESIGETTATGPFTKKFIVDFITTMKSRRCL